MELSLLKSKIHGACVTGADANCEGSVTVSADLAELVGLEEYERILVATWRMVNDSKVMSFTGLGMQVRFN